MWFDLITGYKFFKMRLDFYFIFLFFNADFSSDANQCEPDAN